MYRFQNCSQISFFDFNQSCGMQLDEKNEWVVLANKIPWDEMEKMYAANFPSKKGCPAYPLRIALGSLIIQKYKGLSDRKLVKEISENPYLQYFIGMESFSKECPFVAASLVSFRKRLDVDFMMKANELFLQNADETPEHKEDSEAVKKLGTAILDATCSPSNIKYPQDHALLNDARVKLEEMIDYFHKTYHPWPKPRTYREVARKDYLNLAKSKRKTTKAIRSTIRKQLGCLKRDIAYVEAYLDAGYEMPEKYVELFQTIKDLYKQQKYMYDNKTHHVENRIVSIYQPYLRPIVRGKAKAPVEFGAKYDVSIDEKGHARMEKISFDPYNESTVFQDAIERYRERTGHYPERVLVDKIYRTKTNREYCKEHGIRISGPKLGRPAKEKDPKDTKTEKKDNADRIEVERFFSTDKRCNGAGLIMTKLAETTMASVALSVFVSNLFATMSPQFFWLYFMDCENPQDPCQFLILEDNISSQAS